ncbi:hypothetical protein CR513_15315, partial [Mucuna pruriens]
MERKDTEIAGAIPLLQALFVNKETVQGYYLSISKTLILYYVALKSGLLAHQVELSLVQDPKINIISGEGTVDPEKDKLRVLGDEETLDEFTWHAMTYGHLVNSQRPV